MLAFSVGWFGFFMPGHQRGIVTLPTPQTKTAQIKSTESTVGKPRCPLCVQRETTPGYKEDNAAPNAPESDLPGSPGGSCAICHIKMGLDLPPTPLTIHLDMWLLDEIEPLPYIAQMTFPELRLYRLGRAPPLS